MNTNPWGELPPYPYPTQPTPSSFEQSAILSCNAMSILAKKELEQSNNSLLYNVECGNNLKPGYKDQMMPPLTDKKKAICFKFPVENQLGSWMNQVTNPVKTNMFNENTKRRAPSFM